MTAPTGLVLHGPRQQIATSSHREGVLRMKRIMRVILIIISAAVLMFWVMPNAGAAVPTITSFSPSSGPAGCVVVITGTSFTDSRRYRRLSRSFTR